jgi:hypothetical protein
MLYIMTSDEFLSFLTVKKIVDFRHRAIEDSDGETWKEQKQTNTKEKSSSLYKHLNW